MTNAPKENFKLADKLLSLEEQGLLKELFDLGVVSLVWYDYLQMWKLYQHYIDKEVSKMQTYVNISIEFNCSEDKVQKVIYKLRQKINS
jgi:hypothetical protein